ncbi:uncharacterized protein F5147DRAFT_785148 [Suillus discolor]|uniref:Uncharacterized protein n=1 Tax=Suillus discolor TaxID=1912936 RepID=A0A9P7FKU4_9AGAM|nr:uncharacterized protein F5147DRAFT_785148 [Suillus discolor]KAG2120417.1 hypothetical protein F5147DRAFT_785148 [Suillus discolor]
MTDLVDAYLTWKNGAAPPDEASSTPHGNDSSHFQGFIGCSPLQPTVAISLDCLEVYHQIRRHKASFSVQAMVKTFRDQFAVVFDAYLRILSLVQSHVDRALGRDIANWRMLNSCPACHFKQLHEPALDPVYLGSMDGNNLLKCVDGSGHADERKFESLYLVPPEEVEKFKDDVRLRPGTRIGPDPTPTATSDESKCTENWKTANTISENTVKVFDQTGIFISACRHGLLQTLVEMRKSRELAKYALATTNKILDVYGPHSATGYDIGCSYSTTVARSSISAKAASLQHRFLVNSFHGHAHNRRCQLEFHPLYQKGLGLEDLETCERIFSASNAVSPVIRHAAYFHWLQFIDLHFDQWDRDKYLELSKFLCDNYKQALHIIDEFTLTVEELKTQLGISDAEFEHWNAEEAEYLENLKREPDFDIQSTAYVEALQALSVAEAMYGRITSVQFLMFTPADFTQYEGLHKGPQGAARAAEAELVLEINTVDDLERCMGIVECWMSEHEEYKRALEYLNNRHFIRVVEQLEGLVVQRLFELAKSNLAGTGYKLCQHISNAIMRHSSAIRTALDKYNQLALLQHPPCPTLEYSEVASYGWLGEFELLKHSRHDLLSKPWALKANREVASKHFKVVRAHEEITCLNFEIAWLHAWIDQEDAHLSSVAASLLASNPLLSREVQHRYEERHRVNNVHRARLQVIYDLPGYTREGALAKYRKGVVCSIWALWIPSVKPSSDHPTAQVYNSPSPSIGVVTTQMMDVKPEKERWRSIAKEWYAQDLADTKRQIIF